MSKLGDGTLESPYKPGTVVTLSPTESLVVGDLMNTDEDDEDQPHLYQTYDPATGKLAPHDEQSGEFGVWLDPELPVRPATREELDRCGLVPARKQ